jgi:hypothetical protein
MSAAAAAAPSSSASANTISADLPYDILDIRDEIKKLKLRKLQLIADRKGIQEEIDSYDVKRNALRQELNVLEPLDELRFAEQDDTGGGDPSGGDPASSDAAATEKRHAEMDRKLELQILNAEIRTTLTALEQEAIRCELQTHTLQQAAEASMAHGMNDSAGQFNFLLKGRDDLENDIAMGYDARQKLQQTLSREVETRRREKAALSAEIGRLREEVSAVLDEHDVLKETTSKLVRDTNAVQARIDLLTRSERDLMQQLAEL